VEQTLARLGPEHDNDEVADAVGAVVGILIERLDAEAKEKARMQRQRERRRARREALVGGSVVTLGYVTKTLVERPELRRATLLAAKAARDKARLLFSKMFRSSQPPTP